MRDINEFINESSDRLYGMSFDIKDIETMSKEELEAAHKELSDILYELRRRRIGTSTIRKYISKVEELMK